MKALYDGFDLLAPTTSVSMTINGPGADGARVLPQHRDRPGDASRRRRPGGRAAQTVRGTVQADILKEDQGQNTCLFSTEFSLRCMADIQEWFIEQEVRNFYSVSISGYHIAEAGANPISQLAFTLANGFTYVEAYLARGMDIDDFAPNLSFFFSNGMDPEYSVIGRVARRIWAVAMRDKYGANERSQKLKYHVQTSGRSLHAQEMDFNDIRTTLQALIAIYDNANSLHTNAFDEAVTTPGDGVGTPRAGDPADHQPRVGPGDEREPAPGLLRHRRAHRPGRGRGARRVRPRSTSAAACSARWRPATSAAGSRTSRCSTSTASTTARCRSSASTRSAGPDGDDGTPDHVELARATEDEKASQLRRVREFQAAHAQRGRGRAGPAQGGRGLRRQRVRGPHGRRPGLHARPGHRGVLRGRRAVPAQRLSALTAVTVGLSASGPRSDGLRQPADDLGRRTTARPPGGQPGAVDHRGPGLGTPRGGRRRDRLVHPPGGPRRHARGTGARHQEPRPGRDPRPAARRGVANKEENRELDVRRLRESGIRVWVTDIETVPEAVTSLERLFDDGSAGSARRGWPRCGTSGAAPSRRSPGGSRSPVWRDPWMVVGRDTFTGDLVRRLGWQNVYADSGDRYPKVTLGSSTTPARTSYSSPTSPTCSPRTTVRRRSPGRRPQLVSGRLLTWYGPSLLEARSLLSAEPGGK